MGTRVQENQVFHHPQPVDFNSQYPNVESDDEIRNKIWGPYYKVALTTLQIGRFDEDAAKGKKFCSFLPNIIVILVLLARGIYMLIRMSGSISLSLYWAYSGILFFTALHGLIGALALLVCKSKNYFGNTIDMIRITTRNNVSPGRKIDNFVPLFVYGFVIIPMLFFIAENYSMYDKDVTDILAIPNVTANETARFRESLFGDHKYFFLDGIMIVIGAYIGANAMVVYLHANRAICYEYKKFNKRIQDHIKDGSITQRHVIKELESQLIDYISTARFINNTTSFLMDVTFMAGLFIQICSQFALKGYGTRMYSIQNTMMGLWTAQSVYFLFIATKRPAVLQELMNETTAILWLDQGIWSRNEDPLVREVARSMTTRIDSVDYASKGMSPTRASNIVFNAIMFVIPFFVDIIAAYKYIPWFQSDD